MARSPQHRYAARAGGRPAVNKTAVVAGAAANANIALAGIRRKDKLVSVLEIQPPTAAAGNTLEDRTAAATIFSDGVIRIADDTTGNQVLVQYLSTS